MARKRHTAEEIVAKLQQVDGSCVRLRPQRPNHVWSYDFVADRTHDGKAFRMLCIIDEFTGDDLFGGKRLSRCRIYTF